MGQAASTEADASRQDMMESVIGREFGFRVHRVEPGSPGHAAGLQSIVDYIVVANGVRLDHDDGIFVRMIAESKGTPMRLCVFDTHTLRTRETMLTPNDDWGGSGLLGITIRFDVTHDLSKHTLHVLDVFDDSPASAAGLDAYNDYILGVGDLLYDGPDEFGEIVMHNENRLVRLYVYSVRTERIRDVMITPSRSWGGEGYLGCGVGAGYLHAMPPRRDLHSGRKALPPPEPPPIAATTSGVPPEANGRSEVPTEPPAAAQEPLPAADPIPVPLAPPPPAPPPTRTLPTAPPSSTVLGTVHQGGGTHGSLAAQQPTADVLFPTPQ